MSVKSLSPKLEEDDSTFGLDDLVLNKFIGVKNPSNNDLKYEGFCNRAAARFRGCFMGDALYRLSFNCS